jgi:hypothetical protein
LAVLHRGGLLTAVWVPDAAHEAMRDLIRARLAAVGAVRTGRQQLSAFYCVTSGSIVSGALAPFFNGSSRSVCFA